MNHARRVLSAPENDATPLSLQARVAVHKLEQRLDQIQREIASIDTSYDTKNAASGDKDALFTFEQQFKWLRDDIRLARHFFLVADLKRSQQRTWVVNMFNKLIFSAVAALESIVVTSLLRLQ